MNLNYRKIIHVTDELYEFSLLDYNNGNDVYGLMDKNENIIIQNRYSKIDVIKGFYKEDIIITRKYDEDKTYNFIYTLFNIKGEIIFDNLSNIRIDKDCNFGKLVQNNKISIINRNLQLLALELEGISSLKFINNNIIIEYNNYNNIHIYDRNFNLIEDKIRHLKDNKNIIFYTKDNIYYNKIENDKIYELNLRNVKFFNTSNDYINLNFYSVYNNRKVYIYNNNTNKIINVRNISNVSTYDNLLGGYLRPYNFRY